MYKPMNAATLLNGIGYLGLASIAYGASGVKYRGFFLAAAIVLAAVGVATFH